MDVNAMVGALAKEFAAVGFKMAYQISPLQAETFNGSRIASTPSSSS